jgi:hypothetical protein
MNLGSSASFITGLNLESAYSEKDPTSGTHLVSDLKPEG